MNTPADLSYTDTHEWVRIENDEAVLGITEYAQHTLGDITYVELPSVGDTLTEGAEMGTVESVKAASDLFSPVSGTVTAVNEALADHPDLVNQALRRGVDGAGRPVRPAFRPAERRRLRKALPGVDHALHSPHGGRNPGHAGRRGRPHPG